MTAQATERPTPVSPLLAIPGYDEPAPVRTAEDRIHDGLIALAHWLTDRDDYDIPVDVIRALCPDNVAEKTQDENFHDLLLTVCRLIDRTDVPFEGHVAVDYMTGTRR